MEGNVIATNKKARFEYFIEETYEAGITLVGCEVKSARAGNVNLADSFCFFENGELLLKNCYVAAYKQGSYNNVDVRRDRKLLMHKQELRRLYGKIKEKGYTLVPVQVYFKGSLVKVEIALARGKKLYDKRQDIAKKDARREAERDFKVRNLG